jgi:hypothetical protein
VTVTVTYDSTLSRVRVTANGLGSAVVATVERSVNQIQWVTVRQGRDAVVSGGSLAVPVDDYEFVAGVVNYYRVSYAATITLVGVGTAAHADNAAVNPGAPGGFAVNDLLLCHALVRDFAQTPNVSAGWETITSLANGRLYGRLALGGDAMPTITPSGGSAGNSVSAQVCALRGGLPLEASVETMFNSSQQNIPYPASPGRTARDVMLWLATKQDDWVSAAGPGAEISEATTTLGGDQGMAWYWQQLAADGDVAAGSVVITGGGVETSRGSVLAFTPNTLTQTGSITPTLPTPFLKWTARPYLNQAIEITKWSDVTRRSRMGLFPITGRSNPIAVTDLMGPREVSVEIAVLGYEAEQRLDLSLSTGDPMYLHLPDESRIPSIHCVAQSFSISRKGQSGLRRYFTISLIEVVAPGPDVVGSTATWATLLATYGSWSAVLVAHGTWADVLELVGSPGEVVVS